MLRSNFGRSLLVATLIVWSASIKAQTETSMPSWAIVKKGPDIPIDMAIDNSLARIAALDLTNPGVGERILVNSAQMTASGAREVVSLAEHSAKERTRMGADAIRSRCVRASTIVSEADLLNEALAFDDLQLQRSRDQQVELAQALDPVDYQKFIAHVTRDSAGSFMVFTDWARLFEMQDVDVREYIAKQCAGEIAPTPGAIQLPN